MKKNIHKSEKCHSVKDMPKDMRPREKLQKFGCFQMQNYELIAILLRTGTKNRPVLKLAEELMTKYKKLEFLFKLSVSELRKEAGIGLAKATELVAVFCLAKRYFDELIENEKKKLFNTAINSPELAISVIRGIINDYSKENFSVLCLDVRNRVIDVEVVSTGNLTSSIVHPRETFFTAIKKNAASIIVFHNHPSGDPEPSEDDIKITKKLYEAGKILSIELIDHIIVTKSDYVSMKDRGYF